MLEVVIIVEESLWSIIHHLFGEETNSDFKQQIVEKHYIFILDASGSMQQAQMISYAKGLIHKFAQEQGDAKAYSLIALQQEDATLLDLSVTPLAGFYISSTRLQQRIFIQL